MACQLKTFRVHRLLLLFCGEGERSASENGRNSFRFLLASFPMDGFDDDGDEEMTEVSRSSVFTFEFEFNRKGSVQSGHDCSLRACLQGISMWLQIPRAPIQALRKHLLSLQTNLKSQYLPLSDIHHSRLRVLEVTSVNPTHQNNELTSGHSQRVLPQAAAGCQYLRHLALF